MSAMEDAEDMVDKRVGDGERDDSRSRKRSGESSLSDPAATCCCFSRRDKAILPHKEGITQSNSSIATVKYAARSCNHKESATKQSSKSRRDKGQAPFPFVSSRQRKLRAQRLHPPDHG